MSSKYNEAYFAEWETKLKERVAAITPNFGPDDKTEQHPEGAFKATSWHVNKQINEKIKEQEKLLSKAQSEKNVEAVKAAQDIVENDLKPKLKKAKVENEEKAQIVLDYLEKTFLTEAFSDDADLLRLAAVKQMGGSKGIAAWCSDKEEQKCLDLIELLFEEENAVTLRKFFVAGCPRDYQYGSSIQYYKSFCSKMKDPENPVLQRLALAVALQLASQPEKKVRKDHLIRPTNRYKLYEKAYLAGDLDPSFSQFTAWQMRFAVDCDAPDEEITWARETIRNYSPHHCMIINCRELRYCMIVKSDLGYSATNYYKEPHTYDQLLSGGGKCGPRAWFGRLACKAFGIPAWGCKQPAHAALAVWTQQGWKTVLGGGFQVSFWDGVNGPNFELETKARAHLQTDEAYLIKVLRLKVMADIYEEKQKPINADKISHPASLWYSLEYIQRKRIAAQATEQDLATLPYPKSSKATKVEKLMNSKPEPESIHKEDDGTIVIPAECSTKPNKSTTSENFMKSFLGGKQLLLSAKSSVEYTVPKDMIDSDGSTTYNLIVKLCNVHRDFQQATVTINGSAQNVTFPYTCGAWQDSEPIPVQAGAGSDIKIQISRNVKKGGLAIKELKLVPT